MTNNYCDEVNKLKACIKDLLRCIDCITYEDEGKRFSRWRDEVDLNEEIGEGVGKSINKARKLIKK